ncbi:hypothetical protein BJM58_10355 [Listeria monocytogenes]|nr:hypothetical protein VC38_10190 [Listeria innocua]ODG01037.1 hypothetical protein BB652_12955 [Listeria monocytogenes]OER24116.1 hypothetical protein AF963_05800 [Listeria monocytogenes]OET78085.1 hypothetical protein AJL31_04675 [Listeria monocytogenes]OFF41979.1 hypothetical protein BJM22_09965 [Listeria monocytogenes]
MLEFLLSVIAVFTITLLIVIAFLYFKLYENKKTLYTLCSLYFLCLLIFVFTLIKDFLYIP